MSYFLCLTKSMEITAVRRKKHTKCAVPAGANFLQSGKFQKDLVLLVRGRCLGVLIRGSQNLGTPGKGARIGTFCGVQKVPQKHAEGCDPLDSRGRFKALSKEISAKFSDGTSRNRFFAQNGGEKALNRCEIPVLLRKDLERTAKEEPYSLRTVGYGWVRMGGGGQNRTAFSAHARQCKNEKPFINPLRQHFFTVPKLTCNSPFQTSSATVSLQKALSFSKLCSLASALR